MLERSIAGADVTLAVADDGDGDGVPVVLLHGLTSTRRYVVMGSTGLQRAGHRVIAYDARGHGASTPAPSPDAYAYELLGADLLAVLDELELERAVLAGSSMGAHTILRLALDVPERVAGLVVITPAYDPVEIDDEQRLRRYERLAAGLRADGVEGYLAAYDVARLPESWRASAAAFVRQSIARHEHPAAVADALRVVPRSRPFADLHALEQIECPAVVVASRDEADPGHSLALGEAYAELLPAGRLVVEDEGSSPLAWQGGRMSKVIAELAAQAW
ncbi:MAG TPA: alpha/beta hydrolase [Solirubrobacteraceae bacterium]|jgi:pimeloyl-ACP methyl ester carboxylesterase|nr:alpha/beta hydrolase [Solirubrobacteraceae bacterium]